MRLSFKTTIQDATWSELVAFWRLAEDMEVFAGGWVNDHLYNPGFPKRSDSAHSFEAFATLAALAGVTTRLRLGTLTTANLLRHPAVLARQAVTIDHISGGRLDLGLGAGWHQREHGDHGIDLMAPGERLAAWAEAIEIIDSLMTREETTFRGDYYQLDAARCEPKPLQRPRIPLVLGASGPRALRVVARWADHWNTDTDDPKVLAERLDILRSHCVDLGRDPVEIDVSVQIWARDDPHRVRDLIPAMGEVGADQVVLGFTRPDLAALVSTVGALSGM